MRLSAARSPNLSLCLRRGVGYAVAVISVPKADGATLVRMTR